MTPDIQIQRNQILLTQTISGLGISMDNNGFINGNVEMVNDLEDVYEVGDLVLFNPVGATTFLFESDTYYLVQTNNVFYKENYIPPP